jgi:hypothetical protein
MENVLHKAKNTFTREGFKYQRLLNVYSEFLLRVSICQTMRLRPLWPHAPRIAMKDGMGVYKGLERRVGSNHQSSDYKPDGLPFPHSAKKSL